MAGLPSVLAGTRILVTAQRRSDELAGALSRRGAGVVVTPVLGVSSEVDEGGVIARTREILEHPVDTVMVTTGIGFRAWLDVAEAAGLAEELIAALRPAHLVARGPKARGALVQAGLRADWIAESETSAEMVGHLRERGVEGQRIAVQHHAAGDPMLEAELHAGGATVLPLEVYRWGSAPDPEAVVESVLATGAGEYDAVVFTSAPAVLAFLAELDRQGITEIVRGLSHSGALMLASVGPVTADPLVNAGFRTVFPDRSRMGALVRLVITTLGTEAEGVATRAGVLRVRAGGATLDHQAVALSPNGLAVLRRLARRPGEVVSREELLHALPGDSDDPHTAEVAVARLREALAPKSLVRTVIKRGYVLDLP